MTPEEIRKHLSTYHWQKMSKRRIEFDGKKCQGVRCQSTHNLDAHHKSYENCGKEEEFHDLITLCRSCHKKEHARLNNLNDKQLTLFEIIEKQPKLFCDFFSPSCHIVLTRNPKTSYLVKTTRGTSALNLSQSYSPLHLSFLTTHQEIMTVPTKR